MTGALDPARARELVAREAACLDERRWDDWLAMYEEDACFWVPARTAQGEPTADPERELSLIYYTKRARLAERVQRLRSGKSLASAPLLRTVHLLGPVAVEPGEGGTLLCRTPFHVDLYDTRTQKAHAYFGHYHHTLVDIGGGLIRLKKILLANDRLEIVLDVYSI